MRWFVYPAIAVLLTGCGGKINVENETPSQPEKMTMTGEVDTEELKECTGGGKSLATCLEMQKVSVRTEEDPCTEQMDCRECPNKADSLAKQGKYRQALQLWETITSSQCLDPEQYVGNRETARLNLAIKTGDEALMEEACRYFRSRGMDLIKCKKHQGTRGANKQ